MNNLDDLRAEWIELRKSLGRHIAEFEAEERIRPINQEPGKATEELLIRLRQYRSDVEAWLAALPSEAD